MTDKGTALVLTLIETAYGFRFEPKEVQAWHALLSDVSDDEGKIATVRLCRASPYRPKPSDIEELVTEIRQQNHKDRPALLDMNPGEPTELGLKTLEEIRELANRKSAN